MNQTREQYFAQFEARIRRAMDEKNIPEAMHESIVIWATKGILGGHFLTALMSNNLVEAFSRADAKNTAAMHQYAKLLYNDLPADCWGSDEAVQRWADNGGLWGQFQD